MKDLIKYVVLAGLFTVPFLTLYVAHDYFFPYVTGKNFWFRIIVDVTFAFWVVLAALDAKYRPKFSGLTGSFVVLLLVMLLADLLGQNMTASLWSNFERMDGYVSLLHTFLYFLVLSSVLATKEQWNALFRASLVVALLVAFYGLAQYGGLVKGSGRVDSLLGNAAYMAVYMLFHIFIIAWLWLSTNPSRLIRLWYGLSLITFVFILLETGTRGTAIGLVVGVLVTALYMGLSSSTPRQYRVYTLGSLVVLLLLGSGLFLFRETPLVTQSESLNRIANISVDDLKIRGLVWNIAWQGFQDRPLLGYGQSNFNYVFNQYYDPRLYGQEQWFDRAHNIFADWLVAGGVLGLLAYLSLFGWCIYYLLWRPVKDNDDRFSVVERGVLIGLLVGYFVHNMVVFDNVISYIFFAIILALIASRVGKVPVWLYKLKVDEVLVKKIIAPVMMITVVVSIYVLHVPGMLAAEDLIGAFRQKDYSARLYYFETALSRQSFAQQEIVEQLVQQAITVASSAKLSDEIKQRYYRRAEVELIALMSEKTEDARVYVFAGSFYRAFNKMDEAAKYFALARSASPQKQSIVIQQGIVATAQGKKTEALDFFRTAYTLDEHNLSAKAYYAGGLLNKGDITSVEALLKGNDGVTDEAVVKAFAENEFLLATADQADAHSLLKTLYTYRTEDKRWSSDPKTWINLAYVYYRLGDDLGADAILKEGEKNNPALSTLAECFAKSVESGSNPERDCADKL